MKKNKKRISLILTLALLICSMSFLTGCGGSGGGSGKGLKMMYTMNPLDTFRQLLLDSIQSAANANGVALDVMPECATVDEQVDQIKQAATGGYDAIICQPVDPTTALQLEIAAGDLPIIFVNSLPAANHLKRDKYMFVGSYEWDAGRYQAEYVWDKLGKPSSLNALIFMGQQGHSGTIGRTGAVKEFFRKNNVNANFVFCDYGSWSDEIAAAKFEIFMKTNQSFDAVFCNNDTMALGIVEAMKKHGFSTEEIPVCGVDATADGCQSIIDGGMQFTAYQSASGQGEMSIQTAIALATVGTAKNVNGITEDGTIVWVPFEKVTIDNVKNYM